MIPIRENRLKKPVAATFTCSGCKLFCCGAVSAIVVVCELSGIREADTRIYARR